MTGGGLFSQKSTSTNPQGPDSTKPNPKIGPVTSVKPVNVKLPKHEQNNLSQEELNILREEEEAKAAADYYSQKVRETGPGMLGYSTN